MKNQELYNKTVNILVQAYFNDTLMHDNCYACAVGNLVAANLHIEYIPSASHGVLWEGMTDTAWQSVFCTLADTKKSVMSKHLYEGEAKRQIDSTGYTVDELALIERHFEIAPRGKNSEEHMFNGLMAVIEVLDQIHENTDEATTAKSKALFVKA